MAITFTKVGEANTGYGSSVTIPSFTPTANTLLILTVYELPTYALTVTGHGTWTLVEEVVGNDKFAVYALQVGGSPSASTIQVSYTGENSSIDATCVEVAGAETASVAAAIVQSASNTRYQNGTPLLNTVTLSAFASGTNATYITGSSLQGNGFEAPEAGYTAISPAITNDAGAWYKLTADTSPGYKASFTFAETTYGIAMEIAEAGGPDIDPPDFTSGPTVSATSSTGHSFTFTLNENCTVYAVRLDDGATSPSDAQIEAGTDASDVSVESKSVSVSSGVEGTFTFSTGSLSTAYDYHFIAKDAAGNIRRVSPHIDATTAAGTFSITGGVLRFGAAFDFTYTGLASVASPITIGPDSQGNTMTVAVTDNGPSPNVGSGTMPSLPASGSASRILIEDNLTVTVTEV